MNNQTFEIYQKIAIFFAYIQIFIASAGIIGNILTLFVFLSKPLRKNSYSLYFRVTSWIDTIVLAHSFRHWAKTAHDINIDALSRFMCQFGEYQPFVAASTSNWLRVLISIDRLVRIVYPNHFKTISRKSFQISAVLLVVLFSSLVHIKLPLNYRLVYINSTLNNVCVITPEALGMTYSLALLNSASSTLVACFLNCKLFYHIYLSRRKLKNKLYKPHSSIVKDRKFAISTIGLNTISFICQLTFCISNSAAFILQLDPHQSQAVFMVSTTISAINYGSVFFVSMLMNSIFYKEFLTLIPFKSTL